jgi:hypothetical protein
MKKKSYNLRLFSGWRAVHHYRRFYWLRNKLSNFNLKDLSIIELGCYDGKIINFFEIYPKEYLGLDANWEKGLNIAKKVHNDKKFASFQKCNTPEAIPDKKKWDIGISMQTFEHIPKYSVEDYLLKLSKIIKKRLYITIPIERGFAFILASLTRIPKKLFSRYSIRELVWSFLGKLDKIERIEGHKGFDDRIFLKQLSKYFHILDIEGLFPKLPIISLNVSIGITAIPKKK